MPTIQLAKLFDRQQTESSGQPDPLAQQLHVQPGFDHQLPQLLQLQFRSHKPHL
jgi:hypothetical protein